MSYTQIITNYVSGMKILWYAFLPFLLWFMGETLWIGFLLPAVRIYEKGEEQFNEITRSEVFKLLLKIGFRRASYYKWAILYAAISGVFITNLFWLGLRIVETHLSPIVYLMVLVWGSLLLGLTFSMKGSKIIADSSPGPINSLRYIWGGFFNPFDDDFIQKLRKTEAELGRELLNREV